MSTDPQTRQEEKQKLLQRLADLQTEELREQGLFEETPHFSLVEHSALELGRELSARTQQRLSREIVAECEAQVACPTCGTSCPTRIQNREVKSLTGEVELTETVADCPECRRSFFPSADRTGAGFPKCNPRTHQSVSASGGGNPLL